MKKLFTAILAILFLCGTIELSAQEKDSDVSYVSSVEGPRTHHIKTQDKYTKEIIDGFYEWAYDSNFDYESKLYTLQEFRLEPQAKEVTATYTKGVITINSRLYKWPNTYRKVVWLMLCRHYGVKTYDNKRFNILSEGVNWGDKANITYGNRARDTGADLTLAKKALVEKHPLKSSVHKK